MREWESRVESVEWGLGSRPGSSDLQGWTVASAGETSGAASVEERQDGQLVFLSVKVSHHHYNKMEARSSLPLSFSLLRLRMVVSSPPLPSHQATSSTPHHHSGAASMTALDLWQGIS